MNRSSRHWRMAISSDAITSESAASWIGRRLPGVCADLDDARALGPAKGVLVVDAAPEEEAAGTRSAAVDRLMIVAVAPLVVGTQQNLPRRGQSLGFVEELLEPRERMPAGGGQARARRCRGRRSGRRSVRRSAQAARRCRGRHASSGRGRPSFAWVGCARGAGVRCAAPYRGYAARPARIKRSQIEAIRRLETT